jgi:uncharacterized lipoprotein YajG
MRALLPLLALGLVAGCSGPSQVSATPPTVSYRVTGNDVAQAGVNAQQYCGQFGRTAQFQGIQPTSSGNIAVYACQ